jgi:hypothetical protein
MWIDTRTKEIKVYETHPSDPWVKKMSWDPEKNAWVLPVPTVTEMSWDPEKNAWVLPVPTVTEFADALASGGNPEFVRQAEIIHQFADGKMSYAEMRMHCG